MTIEGTKIHCVREGSRETNQQTGGRVYRKGKLNFSTDLLKSGSYASSRAMEWDKEQKESTPLTILYNKQWETTGYFTRITN